MGANSQQGRQVPRAPGREGHGRLAAARKEAEVGFEPGGHRWGLRWGSGCPALVSSAFGANVKFFPPVLAVAGAAPLDL